MSTPLGFPPPTCVGDEKIEGPILSDFHYPGLPAICLGSILRQLEAQVNFGLPVKIARIFGFQDLQDIASGVGFDFLDIFRYFGLKPLPRFIFTPVNCNWPVCSVGWPLFLISALQYTFPSIP